MRTMVFVLLLWTCTAIFAQPPAYFSELRGLNAPPDFTHLFYRIYVDDSDSVYQNFENHVHHWDLTANTDSLILIDLRIENSINDFSQHVFDYKFINHNPADYIAGGTKVTFSEPFPMFWINGAEIYFPNFGEITNIEISNNNSEMIYASFNYQVIIKSTNHGIDWEFVTSTPENIGLIALSPFDDQILFAVSNDAASHKLQKSLDGGTTFHVVNDAVEWNRFWQGGPQMFFDLDSLHVYAITHLFNNSKMLVSEDAGENWRLAREDSSTFRLAIDEFASGKIYLSSGKNIYFSDDHGQTFSPYWTFSRDIIDLYKKPFSDILYAATKFNIYKITPADTVSIKSLPIVGIADEPPGVISKFALHQNYPNPFNPSTTIAFDLSTATDIELSVFDAVGREVAVLFRGRKTAGRHAVEFDGRNLASGIYFYRLKAGNRNVLSRKMLLIK